MTGRWSGVLGGRTPLIRLFLLVLVVVVGFLAVAVVPAWMRAFAASTHYGSLINGALWSSLVLYGLVLAGGVLGVAILLPRLLIRRRRGLRVRPLEAKALLLCFSGLLALGLVELGAFAAERRGARHERGPSVREGMDEPHYPTELSEGPPGSLRVLVLGESSAMGTPFDPKLSVGQIVAWGLGRVLPGRSVDAEILAYGGAPLEGMHLLLAKLKRRPDVVLIYSGHNEFQARFAWARTPDYYADDAVRRPPPPRWKGVVEISPVGRSVLAAIESRKVSIPPPSRVTRELIDRPCCTKAEEAEVLERFEHRIEGMVTYAEKIGALPVLIIPPGNDAGFDPSRSVLAPDTPRADRERFAADVLAAKAIEPTDPARASDQYRALIDRQPTFAEAHYRLAVLLEKEGKLAEANEHYILARDLDGMPMRCPTAFQDVYRKVTSRHPSVLLIDGPAVFRGLSPTGILDSRLFHDAHHPTLTGHASLAASVLEGLRARGAFGWPSTVPVPDVSPKSCESHFAIDGAAWERACLGAVTFYDRTAYIRNDPSARLARRDFYQRAAERIAAGESPAAIGLP